MLVVVQNANCARVAQRIIPSHRSRRFAFLDNVLCIGPLELAVARRRHAWSQFATARENFWTGLGPQAAPGNWSAASPCVVRNEDRVLVAVESDPNGWLLLGLMLSLCGPELPPSRWEVLWCTNFAKWMRGAATVEAPRRVSAEERRDAKGLWTAATSPTPHAMSQLVASPSVGLSARFFMEQLPEEVSGLTAVDRRLVEHAIRGKRIIRHIVANTLLDFEYAVPHGAYFFGRLMRLCEGRDRVLEVVSDAPDILDRAVAPTSMATDVLDGRANLVELAGIDEFVGAVHQVSGGSDSVWFSARSGGVVSRRVSARARAVEREWLPVRWGSGS